MFTKSPASELLGGPGGCRRVSRLPAAARMAAGGVGMDASFCEAGAQRPPLQPAGTTPAS